MSEPNLPALPLEEWEETKDTLHLYVQIVGKIRLASTPPQNHWWHCPLYVSARGLTTRRMHQGGVSFEIEFDLVEHRLVTRTDRGEEASFRLRDGLSVARFHSELLARLADLGIQPSIKAEPYRVPMTTPFAEDTKHASYDPEYVGRFWRVLSEVEWILAEFAGWFRGKSSPVHLFWHGLDLAVTRFSGRRLPDAQGGDPVSREAYSDEVISFGFWPGGAPMGRPMFYSYTAPEPPGLDEQPLAPDDAFWAEAGSGHQARLWYDDVRSAASPRTALLSFLQSAYEAGVTVAHWNVEELASSWAPPRKGVGALRD
ncbi:MAG: DUF5996 family protein [Gaiellaceae bacterium]